MAQPSIVIRRATPDDFEGIWLCLDSIARERRFLTMVEAPTLAESCAYLEQAHVYGMLQFVAIVDSRVVGWCEVTPRRFEGFRHSASLGMGVIAEYRRRGLGSQLLVETLRAARDQGLTRVELELFSSNRAAIELYEQHGFVREGLKRRARFIDGQVDDVICMAMLFDV